MSDDPRAHKPATDHTRADLEAFALSMPADDGSDAADVARGFIATRAEPVIEKIHPNPWLPISWDLSKSDFVNGPCPDTVNPSLWRQAGFNSQHGLYEVIDGFYQVRGFDTSTVTFIRGDKGWVVIDPLTTTETARAAFDLVTEQLGERPVTAVIYTHSHVDHFGGILGVIDQERLDSAEVPIVAPEGFVREAVAENLLAGPAMGRRAMYQFGMLLEWSEHGHVDQGLGKGVPTGSSALVPPTIEITETGQELVLDGVRVEFQLTPESEAPAEMHFYFPDHRALCMAENCTGTMHNVLTLRGALVRDTLMWSRYIDEAMDRWGDVSDVVFASHGWPHWGTEAVTGYLTRQRDLYRWLHDQSMRLINLGHSPNEISAQIDLPPGLWADYHCHGYYGTVSHNVRAVYQRYLGFYDGHPSSLDPYEPIEAGARYVEFMGGMDQLLKQARASFEAGDHKWVAEVLRHAVFADPSCEEARLLQADAFEQLAWRAESGPWRDIYLSGAQELRHGSLSIESMSRPRAELVTGMDLQQAFDLIAASLDGTAAASLGPLAINWHLADVADTARLELSNGTLHSRPGATHPTADVTVHGDRSQLDRIFSSETTMADLLDEGSVVADGDADRLRALFACVTDFPRFYNIIEP
ncbi:MAG: alkyl sulfatase dimerization domain-containing protein [Acidimicrobiales bacterium]|nr:alkyl sulfatase dimerization domain-containing protein [Acidimicrobiales bacterium]